MMPPVDFQFGRAGRRIAAFLSTITLLALAGCGGTGGYIENAPPSSGETPPPTSNAGGPNAAPTISGTPSTSVVPGDSYTFRPTATDPNGDSITFEIQNRPSWASFDAATGRLSGTPTPAEVGTYQGVVISAYDGTLRTSLQAFSISVAEGGVGNASLAWSAPTLRSDGTALTNLAGYRIYYGRASNTFAYNVSLTNAGLTSYVIDNLSGGTWYFAISAVDSAGQEGQLTVFATKTID